MHVPQNIAQFASTRETSPEIALAIFRIAPEGHESRLWSDPSPDEFKRVTSLAWAMAPHDTESLQWGDVILGLPDSVVESREQERMADWRYAVANGDTVLGLSDWIAES